MKNGSLRATTMVVAAFTLLGLALRIIDEHTSSLIGDELYTVRIADLGAGDAWDELRATESTPPLYYGLAWVFAKVVAVETAIRIPSILFGTLTIPLLYLVGRRLSNPVVGVVAAGLIAFAPVAVYFSVEGRAYGTMVFLAAASTLALLRAMERKQTADWVIYVALAVATLYTHYSAIFVVGAQALWALYAVPEERRSTLLAHGAVALLYLPWLPFLEATPLLDAIGVFAPLSATVVSEESAVLLAGIPDITPSELLGPLRWLLALVVLAAVVAALRTLITGPDDDRRPLLLAAALTLATPVGVLVASAVGDDIFIARNLLASLPGLLLLLAAGLMALPRGAAVAGATALTAVLLYGSLNAISGDHRRPAFRDAADAIRDEAGDDDTIALLNPFPNAPAITQETYAMHLSVPLDGDVRLATPDELKRSTTLARPGTRLFLVSGGSTVPPPTNASYVLKSVQQFKGRVPLSLITYEVRR